MIEIWQNSLFLFIKGPVACNSTSHHLNLWNDPAANDLTLSVQKINFKLNFQSFNSWPTSSQCGSTVTEILPSVSLQDQSEGGSGSPSSWIIDPSPSYDMLRSTSSPCKSNHSTVSLKSTQTTIIFLDLCVLLWHITSLLKLALS